jgi:hypothetical protein
MTASTARRPARESIDQKALRLIATGRVRVALVEPGRALVTVRGDSGGVWRVSYRRGGWTCPCPAYGRCAHLAVALLVVGRPGNPDAAEQERASGTDPRRTP